METLRLLAVQYDIVWENKEKNKKNVEQWLARAPEADVILLPEMFDTGFTMNPQEVAEDSEGTTLRWIQELAYSCDAIVFATWPVREGGKYFNRLFAVRPDGTYDYYDKRYLFSYGGEDKVYHPGKKQVVIEYRGWRIQPFICYDLRFPVWMRNTQAADLYLIPANWPDTRISHWSTLLRARAIENQVYVAGANRVGEAPNGLRYNGGSAVIQFSGQAMQESFVEEKVLYAELSREELAAFRKKFPFLLDRDPFGWK
jgi:predicted amidohydrolase